MKSRVAPFVGVAIVAVVGLGLAAIEIHHWVRFRHFVGYGVHADVLESPSEIGVPGIRTLYAAKVSNFTLFPLRLVGWNYVGDVLGAPPSFRCRFQLQKLSQQDGHWIVVIDFKQTGASQVPVANKRLYPLGSLVPMEREPTGALDTLRTGDLVRFAVFTNLNAPEADVYTEPFRIRELRTPASSSAGGAYMASYAMCAGHGAAIPGCLAGGAYIAFLAMCAITADGRWEGWTPPPGNRTGSSTTATGQAT
jgi:hypothetical protein